MTASIKHLLVRRKPEAQQEPISKFRKSLQIVTGAGLIIAGAELHELGGRFDQREIRGPHRFGTNDNHKEHLGFLVGASGTVLLTSSFP